jgi:hypothetical protein
MSQVEDRIRSTLSARVGGTGIRTMPAGTLRRIRARQAWSTVVASAVVVVFGLAAIEAFSIPADRSRTADGEPSVVVPAPAHGEPTWDRVEAPAPGAWPVVTHGALHEGYVDRTVGEDPSLVVDKTVVDAGRVQGIPWSLVALEQNGEGMLWHPAAEGPCGELYLGSWGDDGGAGFCLRKDDVGNAAPNMSAVGIVWGIGPLSAYAGVVTERIDRVEIVLGSGGSRTVPLLEAHGVSGRVFAVFVPNGARGAIVARDATGVVVARESLCAADLKVAEDATGGCGRGLMGPSSPVVTGA